MSGIAVSEVIRRRALALGFDAVAFARADEPLDVDHERYLAFVEQRRYGAMDYLADHAEARRRLDGPAILEGARSVVCVARSYVRPAEDEARDPPLARAIARYARGRDYHAHLRKRLRRLADFVRGLGPGVRARALCDIEPVLERAWARRAGLGFVGKNGLVIVPGLGSFLLLGEIVTTLELPAGVPATERCGSCTLCLDACPTQAFERPFVLDPRRCIAYLTIELHAPPAEELRSAVGEHFFGCDDCQDACPYNTAAPRAGPLEVLAGAPGGVEGAAPEARGAQEAFRPLAAWSTIALEDVVAMDEPTWDRVVRGTPLRRARRSGLARNAVLVAAGRLGGADARAARRAIERALEHDDESVREVARWAFCRHEEGARRKA